MPNDSLRPHSCPGPQEHTDTLRPAASELGAGLFSKTNSFWALGTERVQRVCKKRATSARV